MRVCASDREGFLEATQGFPEVSQWFQNLFFLVISEIEIRYSACSCLSASAEI